MLCSEVGLSTTCCHYIFTGAACLLASLGLFALAHTTWPHAAQWPRCMGSPPAQNSIHCPAGTAQSVARAVVDQTAPGSKPPGVVFELIKIARIQIGTFGKMQTLICGPLWHQGYSSNGSGSSSRSGRASMATKRAALRSGDSWPT